MLWRLAEPRSFMRFSCLDKLPGILSHTPRFLPTNEARRLTPEEIASYERSSCARASGASIRARCAGCCAGARSGPRARFGGDAGSQLGMRGVHAGERLLDDHRFLPQEARPEPEPPDDPADIAHPQEAARDARPQIEGVEAPPRADHSGPGDERNAESLGEVALEQPQVESVLPLDLRRDARRRRPELLRQAGGEGRTRSAKTMRGLSAVRFRMRLRTTNSARPKPSAP